MAPESRTVAEGIGPSIELHGAALLQGRWECSEIEEWTREIGERYLEIEALRSRGGGATYETLPRGERFVPTASSLTLTAAVCGPCIRSILRQLADLAGTEITAALGG